MECKFCHASMEETETVCPACGRSQEETTPEQAPKTLENREEDLPIPEDPGKPETEEKPEEKKPSALTGQHLMWIAVAAAAVALLAVCGILWNQSRKPIPDVNLVDASVINLPPSLMTQVISDRVVADSDPSTLITEVQKLLGKGIGKDGLTNAQLSIYYWDTFYSFYDTYYYYISAGLMQLDPLTLDTTEFSAGQTWQEYFLSQALNRYRSQTAVLREAKKQGWALPSDQQEQLDATVEQLSAEENIDALLLDNYGPNVTLEDYLEYWELSYMYSSYLEELRTQADATAEQLSAFYDEHAEEYAQMNILKVDKNVISVRHILIQPADKTVEADWATAKTQAEAVYAEFTQGEQTEDAFGELAKLHSADGSASQGGLYEGVYPGQMVTNFNDWCFAEGRKPGDHGIVETEFGYHIMYFVEEGDTVYWQTAAQQDYESQYVSDRIEKLTQACTLNYDMEKIVLTIPGQLEETEE